MKFGTTVRAAVLFAAAALAGCGQSQQGAAALPTVTVVLLALVKAGARSMVRVKYCVAGDPTPLLAEIVIG